MWLSNCVVLKVRDGSRQERVIIENADGWIRRIEPGPLPVADALDLERAFVLPGFISCHSHLWQMYPFSAIDRDEPPAHSALRAASRATQALYAGVTTYETGLLAEAGLSPLAEIKAATLHGAELLRLSVFGGVAPGSRADLIATPSDSPLDIAALRAITLVVQDGRGVRAS